MKVILNPQVPNYEGHCANISHIIASWIATSGNGITQTHETKLAGEDWQENSVEIQTNKLVVDKEGVKHERRNLEYALEQYLHVSAAGRTRASKPPEGFEDIDNIEDSFMP
jgi:hypothetical protein